MSSVCSSWIRSSATAVADGVGATDGEHAAATASSSASSERGTTAMLTSDDGALAPGGDAHVLRCTDKRRGDAPAYSVASVRGGCGALADAERAIVADARADGSREVRGVTAAGRGRRDDGDGLLRRRRLHRESRHRAVHAAG